ncbi:MAG: 1-acyl-sn-glycerol-3-phosphate acyltransferase [Candidatus Dadabacteria bacterium]|nr:1-acyl-sn-glycerol-3-phosphate acyltransferase [Candidatus Dadabacteria bacterium]
MLRTIVCWVAFIVYTVFFGTYGVVLALISPPAVVKYAVRPWARMILFTAGVRLDVEGLENIPDEPSIIMFNHQSVFDIFAYMAVLPIDWKAVMKKEVGAMPFIGWISKIAGHYFVARDGSERDTKEVKKIVNGIKKGPSVMIAPEGTRGTEGKLLPFQKGGFFIAMLAGVPVVPMVITGGLDIMPRGSKVLRPGTMKIRILPPIDVGSLPPGREGREELMRMVRSQMEEVLDREKLHASA